MPLFWSMFRQTLRQPALLFAAVLESSIALGLSFGLHVEYEQNRLSTISFFSIHLQEPMLFLQTILPTFGSTLIMLLMLLFVTGTTALHTGYLRDPDLGIVLLRVRSRRYYLAARIAGIVIAFAANILLFGLAVSLLIAWRTGIPLFFAPLAGALFLILEASVLTVLEATVGLLTDSASAVAVAGMATVLLLGPLVSTISYHSHPVLFMVQLCIPPTGAMDRAALQAALGNAGMEWQGLLILPSTITLFCLSVFLFERRDV